MKERSTDLGEIVWDVLQRLVRELLSSKPGGHAVETRLETLDLRLPLALKGPDADPRRFAANLAAAIDAQLDEAIEHAAAFRPGHAFCHRCDSAVCEHSLPPSCRHVFVGYALTGAPRWEDFAQHCLAIQHPEVDQLYEDPPALVTLVQDRKALQGDMLEAFRNGSSELLGQLVAGFFPVPTRVEEGRGVLALTVQVAASRSPDGRLKLGLNLLGVSPSGQALGALWERQEDLPWRRGIRWAQSALQTVGGRGARSGVEIESRIGGILQGLGRRLAREQRARGRRTRHAEEHHARGKRPIRKALDDAREASGESLLVDERSATLVVLGDRGRTHFFTPEGQLVSSVRYSRDAIARKLKLELWRQASAEETEVFRGKLQR